MTDKAISKEGGSKNRRRAGLAVGISLLILAVGFNKWANNPAVTSSSESPVRAVTLNASQSAQSQPLDTAYFKTTLPGDILVRTNNEVAHGNTLIQLLATSRAGQVQDQLGVTIGILGNQQLTDVSSVRLRLGDTNNYRRASLPQLPAGAVMFERTSELFEKAVFWPNGQGQYAAVVVSGTLDRSPYLDSLLVTVIKGWQWK